MARLKKSMINEWGSHKTALYTDLDTGDMTIHDRQNTTDIIETVEEAKENLKSIGVGAAASRGSGMMPIAEIPMIAYNEAIRLGEENNPDYWKRWLKQPENQPFRIYQGTH
jgi:hypothetical protein